MVGSVLGVLAESPEKALPPHYNMYLVHILEIFRNLMEELDAAKAELQDQIAHNENDRIAFRERAEAWEAELEAIKAEARPSARQIAASVSAVSGLHHAFSGGRKHLDSHGMRLKRSSTLRTVRPQSV